MGKNKRLTVSELKRAVGPDFERLLEETAEALNGAGRGDYCRQRGSGAGRDGTVSSVGVRAGGAVEGCGRRGRFFPLRPVRRAAAFVTRGGSRPRT